jgi:hypothetical protein
MLAPNVLTVPVDMNVVNEFAELGRSSRLCEPTKGALKFGRPRYPRCRAAFLMKPILGSCMNLTMRIELKCAQCGENQFDLREDHADHALVYCAGCGHEIGTLAELKERVADEVIRRSVATRQAA